MTDFAALPSSFAPAPSPPVRPSGYPPVKPRWLSSATTAAVVLAHVVVAALLVHAAVEKIVPLESVSMDLIPEGDMFESEEQQAMDDTPPPEAIEQPEIALPPPQIMHPDAPTLPAKRDVDEAKKRREKREQTVQEQHRQEAQERHRMGMQGGRAKSGGVSKAAYAAMLAAAIHRHVPSSSSLGPGSASCSFHVTGGGGMSGVSCSGSSGAHAAILRRAISSTHAPPPPGGGFFASQSVRFH
jgi:protein TonB